MGDREGEEEIEQREIGIGVLAALEGDGIKRREARVRAPELGLGPKGCGEAGRPGLSLSSLSLILPLTENK